MLSTKTLGLPLRFLSNTAITLPFGKLMVYSGIYFGLWPMTPARISRWDISSSRHWPPSDIPTIQPNGCRLYVHWTELLGVHLLPDQYQWVDALAVSGEPGLKDPAGIRPRITEPTIPAHREAIRRPSFAAVAWASSAKAKPVMKSDMVNPIPASQPEP
jgi:hypothetical protein